MPPTTTPPVTVNPTGAPVLPGQNLDNPTTPANVPVTAPAVPPVTSSTTSTPTAVVSSSTATDDLNNNVIPTVDAATAAKQAADAAAAQAAQAATAARVANQGKPGYDVYGNPVSGTPLTGGGSSTGSGGTPATLDEPDSGNQFIYDKQTGARTQVPVGSQIPSTATTTDVQNAPAVATATTANQTIKQFADGSYGMFDTASGQYIGVASAQNFADAQGVQQAKSDLAAIQNGTYPLTAGQTAQLNNISTYYFNLIAAQTLENTNVTANQTTLENLYGMGGSGVSMSAINKSISDGTDKITALNKQMNDALEAMQASIQSDDINLVGKQYDAFTASVADKQKAIDDLETNLQKISDQQEQDNATTNDAMAKKYPDTTDPILPSDTAAQRQAKLQTSPNYVQDNTIATSLNTDENKFWADMSLSGVSLAGILPNLGIGAVAAQAKLNIMKTIADNAGTLGLTAQDVADSILDKKAKAATYTKLQAQGTQLAAQESKVESDFALVKEAGAQVPDNVMQSGIPILQNWINTGVLGTTGNPALNNYLGLLTTSLTNYARVVAGQTGGSGTTASMNTEVQNIIDKGLSISAVNDYIDKAAIPEMQNTISGYNTTMKSVMGAMNVADGTLNTTGGGLGLGTSSTDTSTNTSTTPTGAATSYTGGGAF